MLGGLVVDFMMLKWYHTFPELIAAVVWGINSVLRIVCPFQYAVLSRVNLAPCLLPESAGFLYDGERFIYEVTADDPC
jgi:hypothetical protein